MELRSRIQAERAAGATWEEIEEISPSFDEWKKVPGDVQRIFPGLKLPKSSLQRWYDLRVEQVLKENLARSEKAREFAKVFAGRDFKQLPDAVRNALGDQVFALMQSADKGDQAQFRKELLNFGFLLAQQRKLDIQERKQNTVERELELKIQQMQQKVQALKKDVAEGKKKITPQEMKEKLDEIYGLGQSK